MLRKLNFYYNEKTQSVWQLSFTIKFLCQAFTKCAEARDNFTKVEFWIQRCLVVRDTRCKFLENDLFQW